MDTTKLRGVQKIINETCWRMAAPPFSDLLRCLIAYVDWPSASVHAQSSSLTLEKHPAQLWSIISLTFLRTCLEKMVRCEKSTSLSGFLRKFKANSEPI